MEMEGDAFIEEVKFLDDSSPQQLPAPFQDFPHLHPCEGFSCCTTCIDPCCNTIDEHVTAERELSRQFIDLAAIVPDIETMDETTVLEETIKYLKQLQERVNALEEQTSYKSKLQAHSNGGSCSSDENFTDDDQLLPQIEARVSDRNVLIRMHCDMHKGVLVKALEETEKLNLSVVNSSAITFGDSTLQITLVAQMDDKFTMAVKDLVKSLRSSLIQFMGENLPQEHDN